jgi:hypothetical protein
MSGVMGHPELVYRIVDVTFPEGTSPADYSVEELTDRFADIFVENADQDAAYYLDDPDDGLEMAA